jgi:hypothetical protein
LRKPFKIGPRESFAERKMKEKKEGGLGPPSEINEILDD